MSQIVTIHSYRGGTGKSNLTANLAFLLAQRGRRVAVVDTDIQSPGIHALFGMDVHGTRRTLNDHLFGRCRIDECIHEVGAPLLSHPAAGALFVVPSSLQPNEIALVLRKGYDARLLHGAFRRMIVDLRLDYVLVDTHPGLNEETLLSIAMSQLVLVVLRPDRQDYQGTAVTIEVARSLGVERLYLALNKVLPALDTAELRAQVTATYKTPIAGLLHLSEEMIRLGSGALITAMRPRDPLTAQIQRIAARIDRAEVTEQHAGGRAEGFHCGGTR